MRCSSAWLAERQEWGGGNKDFKKVNDLCITDPKTSSITGS